MKMYFILFFLAINFILPKASGSDNEVAKGAPRDPSMLDVLKSFEPEHRLSLGFYHTRDFFDLSKIPASEFQTIGYLIMRGGVPDDSDKRSPTIVGVMNEGRPFCLGDNQRGRASRDILSKIEVGELNSNLKNVLSNNDSKKEILSAEGFKYYFPIGNELSDGVDHFVHKLYDVPFGKAHVGFYIADGALTSNGYMKVANFGRLNSDEFAALVFDHKIEQTEKGLVDWVKLGFKGNKFYWMRTYSYSMETFYKDLWLKSPCRDKNFKGDCYTKGVDIDIMWLLHEVKQVKFSCITKIDSGIAEFKVDPHVARYFEKENGELSSEVYSIKNRAEYAKYVKQNRWKAKVFEIDLLTLIRFINEGSQYEEGKVRKCHEDDAYFFPDITKEEAKEIDAKFPGVFYKKAEEFLNEKRFVYEKEKK